MILLLCSISFMINYGDGLLFETQRDVEGILVKEGPTKYLVDFSKDLKTLHAFEPENYKKVLVDKNDCIKSPLKHL